MEASTFFRKAVLFRLSCHVTPTIYFPKMNQSIDVSILVNDLLDDVEKQDVTVVIAIDLGAAFDTVDHDI